LQSSKEERATARLMVATGNSARKLAAELGVDQSTVVRWLQG
jgi:transposase